MDREREDDLHDSDDYEEDDENQPDDILPTQNNEKEVWAEVMRRNPCGRDVELTSGFVVLRGPIGEITKGLEHIFIELHWTAEHRTFGKKLRSRWRLVHNKKLYVKIGNSRVFIDTEGIIHFVTDDQTQARIIPGAISKLYPVAVEGLRLDKEGNDMR